MFARILAIVLVVAASTTADAQPEFHYLHGGNVNDVFFWNSTKGWTAEDGGRIRWTTDGGNTWTPAHTPDNVRGELRGLFFLSDDLGWAVGENGVVLQSIPNTFGQDWLDLTMSNRVTDSFSDATTPCDSVPADLYDIFMMDAMTGWVAGIDGAIRKTTNNWLSFLSPNSGAFNVPAKFTCAYPLPYDS